MISLGLGTLVGGNGSSFGGFTAEYQAILSRATSSGITLPSLANQANQNKLIVDLKAAGVWDKLDVFYMFANTGSSGFALLNWKNPNGTSNASAVGSLTFNGSAFQGAALSYLNTNYNPTTQATNFSQNNAGIGVWKRTHDATPSKFMWGNSGASSYVPSITGTDVRLHNTGGLSNTFALSTTGLLILNRTASTAISFSVNGTATSTTTTASVVPVNANYSVFTYGTATASTYLGQISSFFLGASIVSETSAFYTAMNTYMTTL